MAYGAARSASMEKNSGSGRWTLTSNQLDSLTCPRTGGKGEANGGAQEHGRNHGEDQRESHWPRYSPHFMRLVPG